MASIFRRAPRLRLTSLVSTGGSSQLVADDFFEASSGPVYDAILRRWNGLTWVKAELKRWNGSTWVAAEMNYWTGSTWASVDTTGI